MSTDLILAVESKSYEETEKLGEAVGSKLRGGEVIELRADLGGGKTTFTRGLVRGCKSSDIVNSPTFMVCRKYRASGFDIFHYDFYRIANDPTAVAEAMSEQIKSDKDIIVIEWADSIRDSLSTDRAIIDIEKSANMEDARIISIYAPVKMNYLVEDIKND